MSVLLFFVSKIYIEIYEIIILLVLAMLIVLFVIVLYNQYYKKIQEENDLRHQQELKFQTETKALALKTQEEERKRIARTLHDEIGNKLQVLKLNLISNKDQIEAQQYVGLSDKIEQLIDSAREISHRMYPVNLEYFGLILTLEELKQNLVGYDVELYLHQQYQERPLDFEVQIYRVILEFVSNTIKHAKANKISILVRDGNYFLSFLLKDNGMGFEKMNANGMGVSNISNRVELLDGKSKLSSALGKGTRLMMVFPKMAV